MLSMRYLRMNEQLKFKTILRKLNDDNVLGLSGSVTYINNFSLFELLKLDVEILNEITHVRCDGGLLAICLWPFTGRVLRRASFDMTSDAKSLFEHLNGNKAKVVAIGGTERENHLFVKKMTEYYPQSKWCGINGFLDAEEIVAKVIQIPDVDCLIVGLGTPLQERVQYLLKDLEITSFTCGGFITQTSKSEGIKYYPDIIDRMNLRWLFRMINEQHVARRVLVKYPISLAKLVKLLIRRDYS